MLRTLPRSRFVPALGAAWVVAWVAPAEAQSGTPDQDSPALSSGPYAANFNADMPSLVWRQQVRAGLGGRLEGVRLVVTRASPSSATLRIRAGTSDAPGPVLAESIVHRTQALDEPVFIDVSGSAIELSAGQTFTLELQGNGSGLWVLGSNAAPPDPALYPEPLFLNGIAYFEAHARIGFTTFMLTGDRCAADLTTSSDPNDPAYGVPDGMVDASDFFYFLDQFAGANVAVADLTGSSDPNDPAYGVPDGAVDASDFFYYLDLFVEGC